MEKVLLLRSLLSNPDKQRDDSCVHDQGHERDLPAAWRTEKSGHEAQLGAPSSQGRADHTFLISRGFGPWENEQVPPPRRPHPWSGRSQLLAVTGGRGSPMKSWRAQGFHVPRSGHHSSAGPFLSLELHLSFCIQQKLCLGKNQTLGCWIYFRDAFMSWEI